VKELDDQGLSRESATLNRFAHTSSAMDRKSYDPYSADDVLGLSTFST
jgi:hypothetical protein